jgi:hypothetical protein
MAGCSANGVAYRGHARGVMNNQEFAYLLDRIKQLETVVQSMGNSINNVDVRLMVAERAIAGLKHRMQGEHFDETKQAWWN